jgi:D-alanyl-D-alanine carboxypeptidase
MPERVAVRVPAFPSLAAVLALACAPASAQLLQVQPLPPAENDAMLGHLPYADVGRAALVDAPAGFALGQPCRVRPAVAAALARLLAAKTASGVPGELRGVSCYRSVAHQRAVFCRGSRCIGGAERARMIAPPGYSEHETGYAIDFAVRPAPGCGDTKPCIAATPAGQWLLANGARFGFELSFPPGNAQGVEWEPWHWRWVGLDGEDRDAADARTVFAPARARYPAQPAVPPIVVRVAAQPPVLAVAAPVSAMPPPRRRHGLFGPR